MSRQIDSIATVVSLTSRRSATMVAMTTTHPDEYRSGTGKVIRLNDKVTVDSGSTVYTVTGFREEATGLVVNLYGGSRGKLKTITRSIDRVHSIRGEVTDSASNWRAALSETAAKSKRGRRY